MNEDNWQPGLLELGRGFRDLLFPPSCIHCGGLVQPGHGLRFLCEPCSRLVHRVDDPACPVCGHPYFGLLSGERICPHCLGLHPAFGRGVVAVLHKGPAKTLVREVKYHGALHLLCDIETLLRESPRVLNLARDATLVPVPMHPRKRRERGFNQAELIAERLSRILGGRTRVASLLRRLEDTGSQTTLDRESRLENLRHAFGPAPKAKVDPEERYVLVDDVFTTGSTLNRCALALRRAGARQIDVCCVSHG